MVLSSFEWRGIGGAHHRSGPRKSVAVAPNGRLPDVGCKARNYSADRRSDDEAGASHKSHLCPRQYCARYPKARVWPASYANDEQHTRIPDHYGALPPASDGSQNATHSDARCRPQILVANFSARSGFANRYKARRRKRVATTIPDGERILSFEIGINNQSTTLRRVQIMTSDGPFGAVQRQQLLWRSILVRPAATLHQAAQHGSGSREHNGG